MGYISVFDADACITMARPLQNGYSLLSELVLYFDNNYMHKTTYDEVKVRHISNGQDAKTHLEKLKNQNIIEILTDEDLLELLKTASSDLEIIACNYYISSLKDNINNMSEKEKNKLNNLYKPIFDKQSTYSKISDLVNDLNNIESRADSDTSMGEMKAGVLIDVLHFIGLENINFFVSNDVKARRFVTDSTNGRVSTSSAIGTFIILRDNGFTRNDASKYFDKFSGKENCLKVINTDGKKISKTYRQVFEDIFSNQNIYLTKEGLIHY